MAKKDLEQELQNAFDRWDHLFTNGGSDPFWSDGCNLNLVRNHIIYHKKQIEDSGKEYPAIYYRETPQEISADYMADSEGIRLSAKKALALYENDENYKFLLSKKYALSPKNADKVCLTNVLGYVTGLENAIESDDLVSMRRHKNPEAYLLSFLNCAEQVKAIKPIEKGQLSLFEL